MDASEGSECYWLVMTLLITTEGTHSFWPMSTLHWVIKVFLSRQLEDKYCTPNLSRLYYYNLLKKTEDRIDRQAKPSFTIKSWGPGGRFPREGEG